MEKRLLSIVLALTMTLEMGAPAFAASEPVTITAPEGETVTILPEGEIKTEKTENTNPAPKKAEAETAPAPEKETVTSEAEKGEENKTPLEKAPADVMFKVEVEGAEADTLEAPEGAEVVLTPDNTKEFLNWEVVEGEIEILDNKFIMPKSNVVIKAVYKEEAALEAAAPMMTAAPLAEPVDGGDASTGLDFSASVPAEKTVYKAGTGTITFEPASPATLTLDNASIAVTGAANGITLPAGDVNIVLTGENNITTAEGTGIAANGNVNITGDKLNITCGALTSNAITNANAESSINIKDTAIVETIGLTPNKKTVAETALFKSAFESFSTKTLCLGGKRTVSASDFSYNGNDIKKLILLENADITLDESAALLVDTNNSFSTQRAGTSVLRYPANTDINSMNIETYYSYGKVMVGDILYGGDVREKAINIDESTPETIYKTGNGVVGQIRYTPSSGGQSGTLDCYSLCIEPSNDSCIKSSVDLNIIISRNGCLSSGYSGSTTHPTIYAPDKNITITGKDDQKGAMIHLESRKQNTNDAESNIIEAASVTFDNMYVVIDGKMPENLNLTLKDSLYVHNGNAEVKGNAKVRYDVKVAGGETLTINEGSSLTIAPNQDNSNVYLEVFANGTVKNHGKVEAVSENTPSGNGNGEITNNGTWYNYPGATADVANGTVINLKNFTKSETGAVINIAPESFTLVDGKTYAQQGKNIKFTLDVSDINNSMLQEVSYKIGEGEAVLLEAASDGTYTIPGASITGDVTITATAIGEADVITNAPTAANRTYDGADKALVNKGTAADTFTMQYKLEESGTWSENIPTAKNAGDYNVYYKAVNFYGEYGPAEPVKVKIAKKDIAVPSDMTFTYDGTVKTFPSTDDYKATNNTATNTNGEGQAVTLILNDTANTRWVGDTIDNKLVKLIIKPKELSWDISDLSASKRADDAENPVVYGKLKVKGLVGEDTVTYTAPEDLTIESMAGTGLAVGMHADIQLTGSLGSLAAEDTNYELPATLPKMSAEVVAVIPEDKVPAPIVPNAPAGNKYKTDVTEGITSVPTALQSNPKLDTPEKIETFMKTELVSKGINGSDMEVYDVKLMIKVGDGGWTPADQTFFDTYKKLTVILPYPEGTGMNTHNFSVVHMFTTAAGSHAAGDIENPAVTKTAEGIKFDVTGLSPVSVGWTLAPHSSASSDSYLNQEREFWDEVTDAIENSHKGETIKVDASDFTKMPWYVMETLRKSDNVILEITWDGKDIVIPSEFALSDTNKVYYNFKYLAQLDFTSPVVVPSNPATGAEI